MSAVGRTSQARTVREFASSTILMDDTSSPNETQEQVFDEAMLKYLVCPLSKSVLRYAHNLLYSTI